MDNCSTQNKCWTLFTRHCQVVTVKYVEPGHTFMAADSFHQEIEDEMRRKRNLSDLKDFENIITVFPRMSALGAHLKRGPRGGGVALIPGGAHSRGRSFEGALIRGGTHSRGGAHLNKWILNYKLLINLEEKGRRNQKSNYRVISIRTFIAPYKIVIYL